MTCVITGLTRGVEQQGKRVQVYVGWGKQGQDPLEMSGGVETGAGPRLPCAPREWKSHHPVPPAAGLQGVPSVLTTSSVLRSVSSPGQTHTVELFFLCPFQMTSSRLRAFRWHRAEVPRAGLRDRPWAPVSAPPLLSCVAGILTWCLGFLTCKLETVPVFSASGFL